VLKVIVWFDFEKLQGSVDFVHVPCDTYKLYVRPVGSELKVLAPIRCPVRQVHTNREFKLPFPSSLNATCEPLESSTCRYGSLIEILLSVMVMEVPSAIPDATNVSQKRPRGLKPPEFSKEKLPDQASTFWGNRLPSKTTKSAASNAPATDRVRAGTRLLGRQKAWLHSTTH
jgi:hypothetical protein